MQFSTIETAWGTFGYVACAQKLVSTYLPASRKAIRIAIAHDYPDAVERAGLLPDFRREVQAYYRGKPTDFGVAIDLAGLPAFRRGVLEACRRVPFGKKASYADLGRAMGKPGAARAVGGAMAHNPIPLVIPCHRIVRSDGSIGGFSSPEGIKQKQQMLLLENALFDVKEDSPSRSQPRRLVG